MISTPDVLILAGSFLLGSVPFSVVIGKMFYRTDVRQFGSGNPGATNVLRTLGPAAGFTVLILDVLKGLIPVVTAKYFMQWPEISPYDRMIFCGALAIAGHVFSP